MESNQIEGATRLFGSYQDGEFSVPYSFLNEMMTSRLITEGYLTSKEFLRVRSLVPDDPNNILKVSSNIYRYMDN